MLFQESKPAEGGDAGSEYIKLKVVGQVRSFDCGSELVLFSIYD